MLVELLIIKKACYYVNNKAIRYKIIGKKNKTNVFQAIWIPKSCLAKDGMKIIRNIDWFWNEKINKHKLFLAGYIVNENDNITVDVIIRKELNDNE